MGKIQKLPDVLISQIAAGEVVERPASLIKELVENSVDADAKRIFVEVNGSGEEFIRITDDGCGMTSEDALMAFERHATSKISTNEDLFKINTFGFRGEALASIASVAKILMKTKAKGALEGSSTHNEGGKIISHVKCGAPEGTQIEIKDLFYNTPARKKFLKAEATEFTHISDVMTAFALFHNDVAFRFIHNGKTVFDLPATEDALARMRAVLGKQVSDSLIPVFYGHETLSISGFIGKPEIARLSRSNQFIFVNGREIKSHVLGFAVKQAYHSLLLKERHPVFILFIKIAPNLLDVNVHPRKLEVKFLNEKDVFKAVTMSTEKSLETNVLTPKFEDTDTYKINDAYANIRTHKPLVDSATKASDVQDAMSFTREFSFSAVIKKDDYENKTFESGEKMGGGDSNAAREDVTKYKFQSVEDKQKTDLKLTALAQLNASYILCSSENGLTLVDQHAAHERVLYEQILHEFEAKKIICQPLLLPEQIDFSAAEKALYEEHKDLFKELGFEINEFGGNTYNVSAVPSWFLKNDITLTIFGMLEDFKSNNLKNNFTGIKERALRYMACRSAVKFGDILSLQEQEVIIKKLGLTKLPFTCPHGRPSMVEITMEELKRKFHRDYRP